MEKMIDSKEIILENINIIFKEYNDAKEYDNKKIMELIEEINELRDCNNKLISENLEKDKLLIVNDKKMIDYENMINKIQDDAMKEKTEKERFDMLKKQDKEIHDRDIEIKRLQKKVNVLEDKLSLLEKKSDVDDDIVELRDTDTDTDSESLVERMKKNQKKTNKPVDNEYSTFGEETVIVDNKSEVEEVEEKPVVDENKDEVEKPTEVVENPDDKIEGEDSGEETEELSEEEDAEVEILTYYKKDYYVVINESPQGIYMIVDGELGNKVGEIQGKKKIFYNSSKN
jgi:hypothetical protein